MAILGINSTSPLLHNTLGLTSLLPISFGLYSFLRPQSSLPIFNLSPSTSSPSTTNALIHLIAIRDIALGIALFGVWRTGNPRALGWVVAAGTLTAVGDGWLSWRQKVSGGVGMEWLHWGVVPWGVGAVAALFGFFD